MVEFRILGASSLRSATGHELRSILSQPKRMALLSYIALASPGQFQRRERLLGLFWPHLKEKQARAALSVALHHLKNALGSDAIVTRGTDEIGLAAGEFWCDAIEFMGAVADDDLLRAADLYRGSLLDAFYLDGAPDFGQWLDILRERMRGMAVESVGKLADAAAMVGDPTATMWGRRALELAPYDDDAAQRILRLLAASGHRAEAITIFEGFARRLESDLEFEPTPQTLDLVAKIRAGERLETSPGVVTLENDTEYSVPREHELRAASPVAQGPRRWSRVGVALAIGVAIVAVTWLGRGRRDRSVETVQIQAEAPTIGPELRLLIVPPVDQTEDQRWTDLAQETDDAMRRAINRHVGTVDLVASALVEDALRAFSRDDVDVLRLGQQLGATRAISSRYELSLGTLAFTLVVVNVSTGETLRTFDVIRGAPDSDSVIAQAADAAAIAAMLLAFESSDFQLRYSSLPRNPRALRSYQNHLRAFYQGRPGDAANWGLEAIAVEPEWPAPYLATRTSLHVAGRGSEWAALEPKFRALQPSMTDDEQLYLTAQTGATLDDAIEAAERRFRLTGGSSDTGFVLAHRAIAANRLHLAREGLDAQSFEIRRTRNWPSAWTLDALVHHLLGNYSEELERATAGIARFSPNAELALSEARAFIGLNAIAAATEVFDRIDTLSLDVHTRWEVMFEVAHEFRRHGHFEASERALGQLIRIVENEPEIHRFQRAETYYAAGMYQRAIPLFEQELEGVSGFDRLPPAAMLIISLEAIGRSEEATRYEYIMQDFLPDSSHPNRRWAAAVAGSRGDPGEAVRLLQEAFQADVWYFGTDRATGTFLHVRPEFDPIRDHPLFVELMVPKN